MVVGLSLIGIGGLIGVIASGRTSLMGGVVISVILSIIS